jgi:heavy metal efflux system protein
MPPFVADKRHFAPAVIAVMLAAAVLQAQTIPQAGPQTPPSVNQALPLQQPSPPSQTAARVLISMEEAVQRAFRSNQQIRAQRLNVDQARANEINVADVNTLIETAIGGKAVSQVIQGERQFDLVLRAQEPFRNSAEAIKNLLVATPDGQNLPLGQLADIRVSNGASFIYREANSRYIGVQFSVEGRDLAGAVEEARSKVASAVQIPTGYTLDWGGEFKDYLAARQQMNIILPLTAALILLILFALNGNLKLPVIIMFSVLVTEPVGGLLALKLSGINFSVSSMLGFVALIGVAVQTSVILYSFANKLRLEGKDIFTATYEASLLRLRPIVMTALVAALGLLPAVMSSGIGSDSQRPFAIVVMGGLISRLLLSVFLAPVLYMLVARKNDVLKV